jgi:hypothetical protein
VICIQQNTSGDEETPEEERAEERIREKSSSTNKFAFVSLSKQASDSFGARRKFTTAQANFS